MTALNGTSFWLGIILVSAAIPAIVFFLADITRLVRYVKETKSRAPRFTFRLAVALLGLGLILIGYNLVEARSDLLGGFLLATGIQTFFWVIGIRLELLGNVTDDIFDWQGEEETSHHASSAVQQ